MRATSRLLQYKSSIILFTRDNCSLCENAKLVLRAVGAKKRYRYEEIDVMSPGQEAWKVYEFDTPVVHVYPLSSTTTGKDEPTIVKECGKLMHRFTENQLLELINEAEKT